MAGESRQLLIVGEFRDKMSAALTRVRAAVSRTQDRFAKFAAAVSAPFRAVGRTFDALRGKILNVQNVVAGFIAVLAVRRTFGFLEEIAQGLDEIVKLSDRLQATTESLSALRYIGDLSAVSFQEISVALATYSRSIEAALKGSTAQSEAFRALGLDIGELAKVTRIDLVDLLIQTADGMENLESATERNNALLTVFGESGAKLGPVLAAGSDSIRELADEAERLGVVFSKEQLDRAAAFNDALTRFSTSIRSTFQAIFIEIAPRISAVFENLAFQVSDNRRTIVEAAKEIGKAIGGVLELIVEGVVEFVGVLESIPGVNLSGALGAQLQELNEQLEAVDSSAAVLEDRIRGIRNVEAIGLGDPGARFTLRQLEEQLAKLYTPEVRAAAARRGELIALGVQDGLAGTLRARIGDFRDALKQTLDKINGGDGAGSVSQDAGRRAGELFGQGFAEGIGNVPTGGEVARSVAEVRRAAAEQRLEFEATVLGIGDQTAAVQQRLAEIAIDLRALDFDRQFVEGKISAEQLDQAMAALENSLESLTRKAQDDFGAGFAAGFDRATESLLSMQRLGEEAAGAVVNQLTNGLGNALGDIVTGTKSAKEAFRDFGLETLRILGQLLARLIAIQAVRALGLGFEAGGIMPGEMRESRRLPIKQYATGGIARTPQMAVFGEGQGAEAFVPLPDGRRIPVDLRGAGGGGLTLVLNTVDSKDTARWLLENRGLLLAIQNAGLESSAASRRAVRSVS